MVGRWNPVDEYYLHTDSFLIFIEDPGCSSGIFCIRPLVEMDCPFSSEYIASTAGYMHISPRYLALLSDDSTSKKMYLSVKSGIYTMCYLYMEAPLGGQAFLMDEWYAHSRYLVIRLLYFNMLSYEEMFS